MLAGVILVVVLLGLSVFPVYRIRQRTTETLLWDDREAYLFVNLATVGYHPSYLGFLLDATKEFFGASTAPDNRASSVLIFHVTGRGVETHTEKNLSLDFYTPLEGNIYANRQGTPVKWSGEHFEPVNGSDRNQIFQAIFNAPKELNDVDGWSRRDGLSAADGDNRYSFTLAGKPMTLVVQVKGKAGTVSIEIESPGEAPQQIYFLDGRLRSVSGADYDRLFL